MNNRNAIIKVLVVGALGGSGFALGCNSGGTDTTGSTEAAIKAASPACTSARDACKAQVEPVVAGIEAACKPIEAACEGRDGGGASAACTAARLACSAAFAAAKPQLAAIGASCEASIRMACVIDAGGAGPGRDGGVADDDDHDHDGGDERDHGGILGGHVESAACEAAELACRQSLESLRAMPPAACTSIEAVCGGQGGATASDACKAAIIGCHDAITAAAGSTCGADIAAACGGHGG